MGISLLYAMCLSHTYLKIREEVQVSEVLVSADSYRIDSPACNLQQLILCPAL